MTADQTARPTSRRTDAPHRTLAHRRRQLVLAAVVLLVDAVLLARHVRAYRAAYRDAYVTAWAAAWTAARDEATADRGPHRPTAADR